MGSDKDPVDENERRQIYRTNLPCPACGHVLAVYYEVRVNGPKAVIDFGKDRQCPHCGKEFHMALFDNGAFARPVPGKSNDSAVRRDEAR